MEANILPPMVLGAAIGGLHRFGVDQYCGGPQNGSHVAVGRAGFHGFGPQNPKDTCVSNLAGSSRVVSILTLGSRCTGLLRDAVFARSFGVGGAADIFFVAFQIPNLFRRLFGEGAWRRRTTTMDHAATIPIALANASAKDECLFKTGIA